MIPIRPLPAILFQDQRFVVIDKPAGLPVHPGPAGGPSVEDWFPLLSKRRDGPWLAHRLDADTAGCLVIAFRKAALLEAQAAFAAGQARKVYWAVVRGDVTGTAGTIDRPLLRRTGPDGWRIVVDPRGQAATTDWRVMGHGEGLTWLELRPRTGRTHQIRVHCAELGCPILGDARYGGGDGPMHLLARAIRLALDPPVEAVAEPPDPLRRAFTACGWSIVPATGNDRKIS